MSERTVPERAPARDDLTLQDRVAILEDLVSFHSERNMKGVCAILRIASDLGTPEFRNLSAEEIRERIRVACAGLTLLAHELAIGSLDTPEMQTALRRWPYILPFSATPS